MKCVTVPSPAGQFRPSSPRRRGSEGRGLVPSGAGGQRDVGGDYQEDATGLKLLGHRYYDPSTGRFLTRDPIRDGRNWYAYCSNNPLRWVDPSGLLHVVIWIGPDGKGTAKVFADEGDQYYDDRGFLCTAVAGQLLGQFPVSNIVTNRGTDPTKVEGGGPFPPGTWPIIAVEPRKNPSLGPDWVKIGGIPENRGTWLHGGKGSDWSAKTGGCVRGSQDAITWLAWLFKLNKDNGNDHHISVNDWMGLALALTPLPVRLPIVRRL